MTRMHMRTAIFGSSRRTAVGVMLAACVVSTGCTTNYLTNSTEGTYGVPMTERTIPQRLLDRSIEHTVKINIYGLKEDLQQTSRMGIDSFNSEVLLTGEVPTEALKIEVEKVVSSMPDVRRVYNEMEVSASKGYSSTVHDGYITSKLLAKVAASDGVKASQIKAVTDNGVVYILGRMTPTQQSHLIDIANTTVGVTELVLLTTVVDDRGVKINDDDIMYESNLSDPALTPVAQETAISSSTPIVITEEDAAQSQQSSSPYIELYRNQ
ncbi:BON domain-containing protein [Psychrobacter sp. NG27]|nr:BON domain-containing protein [Psychrobacter sp. NG27]